MKNFLIFVVVFLIHTSSFAGNQSQVMVTIADFENWGMSEMRYLNGKKMVRGSNARYISLSTVKKRRGQKFDMVTPVTCVVTKWPNIKSTGVCWPRQRY